MRSSDGSSYVCSSDLRHLHEVAVEAVGHILPAASVIGDFHVEGFGLAGDVLADAPETEDAEAAATECAGQMHRPLQPLAFTHVAVAVADLARGGEQQGDRHVGDVVVQHIGRSEEHTSELQSLMSISYAVFCLK